MSSLVTAANEFNADATVLFELKRTNISINLGGKMRAKKHLVY